MTTVYEAIMKAADLIESHPNLFNFRALRTPPDCRTPACFIGWTAFFLGKRSLQNVHYMDFPEMNHHIVYPRMLDINSEIGLEKIWTRDAATAAKCFRLYASKYHAPQTRTFSGIPDSIRQIFEVETA